MRGETDASAFAETDIVISEDRSGDYLYSFRLIDQRLDVRLRQVDRHTGFLGPLGSATSQHSSDA